MKSLKIFLILLGASPLLVIPSIGILYASAPAVAGFLLLTLLIALQWPVFRLFRRLLPARDSV